MLEVLSSLLTDHWQFLGSCYFKVAVLLYGVCYVVEVILGKYNDSYWFDVLPRKIVLWCFTIYNKQWTAVRCNNDDKSS